jgi:Arc/MetJ-type ribon-helix-helix transcriptional regulator
VATKVARAKLSTTVSPETFDYLTKLVESGKVRNLAEAVDEAVEQMRMRENRRRLAHATTEYYESLPGDGIAEEHALAESMRIAARKVNFNREP